MSSLPKKFYRAVHDTYPIYGTRARGYSAPITTFTFMMHVENHLQWACKRKSPFMSITPSYPKASELATNFVKRGKTGVRILELDLSASGSTFPLWGAGYLVEKFDLTWKEYYRDEYLTLYNLPLDCVVRSSSFNYVLFGNPFNPSLSTHVRLISSDSDLQGGREAPNPKQGHSFFWRQGESNFVPFPPFMRPQQRRRRRTARRLADAESHGQEVTGELTDRTIDGSDIAGLAAANTIGDINSDTQVDAMRMLPQTRNL